MKSTTSKPVYGPTNPTSEEKAKAKIQRFGSAIELRPEQEQAYRKLHANAWPAILERIKQSHIRNYNIYIAPIGGKKYLFSYFEYTGSDFNADMQAMADDPETQRWWEHCKPCQKQLPNTPAEAWWLDLEEVFHLD